MSIADERLAGYEKDLYIELYFTIRNEATGKDERVKKKIAVWKFIERFLHIRTKDGPTIKFILNEEQVDLYKEICEQRRAGKPVRLNILKARQIGFSTFIAALYFCLVIFVPNRRAIIVADTAEHATNLFDKYKLFYEMLPKELQVPTKKSNAKALVVDYGGGSTSEIKIVCEGDNAARSDTAQFLHNSEAAFWSELNNTMASLNQVVSVTNKDSFIIFETTANGYNEYKTLYDKHVTGESSYKALFYPWWGHKDYQEPYRGFELMPHEQKLIDELHLTYEQIAWYRLQFDSVGENLDKLRQEHPSTPSEAFIGTGNCAFNLDLIHQRKDELHALKDTFKKGFWVYKHTHNVDNSKIKVSDIKFVESKFGAWTIYKDVESGHPYVMNCDPAMGGKDYYAVQVINNYTGEQVAVYHCNRTNDDEVAYQMYCMAEHYNHALVSSETNTTIYILQILHKCGYDFIYKENDFETISDRYVDKFGYKTKQTNRNAMISMFKEVFSHNYKCINDYATLCEMENFQIVRNESTHKEKALAIGDNHDDLVMAFAGCLYVRNEQEFTPKNLMNTKFFNDEDKFSPFYEKPKKKVKGVYQVW